MGTSRLFEPERITMITAVSWFFDGPGGTFHYWRDGPTGEHREERAPFANVASSRTTAKMVAESRLPGVG